MKFVWVLSLFAFVWPVQAHLPSGSVSAVPNPPLTCSMFLSAPRVRMSPGYGMVITMQDRLRWTDVLRGAFIRDLPFPLRFLGPRLQMGLNKPDALISGSALNDVPPPPGQAVIVDTKFRTTSAVRTFDEDSREVRLTFHFLVGRPQNTSYIFREPGHGIVSATLDYDGHLWPRSTYLVASDQDPAATAVIEIEKRAEPGMAQTIEGRSFLSPELMLHLSQLAMHLAGDRVLQPIEVHYQTHLENQSQFAARYYPMRPDGLAFHHAFHHAYRTDLGARLWPLATYLGASSNEAVKAWSALGSYRNRLTRVVVVEVNLGGRTVSYTFAESTTREIVGEPQITQHTDLIHDRVITNGIVDQSIPRD